MPMFTMISGFLYKDKSLKKVILKFFYPCIIFSLLNNYIGGGIPLYVEKVGVGYFKIGYTMWYIWALFIYYAILPIAIRKLGWKYLMAIGMSGVFILDFIPLPNSIFQLCRVINFFPFFLLGMFLKRNLSKVPIIDVPSNINKFSALTLLICILIYVLIVTVYPQAVYDTGMVSNPGFSLSRWVLRCFTYVINTIMIMCLIFITPDKSFWITKYSSRTLNVYMLHMSVVFPLCWLIMPEFMFKWFGYLFGLLVVPAISCVLFSKPIDKIMNILLGTAKL